MNGRKRHLVVDTMGMVVAVAVHPADVNDREGAKAVVASLPARFPRLRHLWADQGYQGAWVQWVAEQVGIVVEIVRRPAAWAWVGPDEDPDEAERGFQVQPRRWVVERTFAWIGRNRRMSKEYEYLPTSSEAYIYLSMSRLMLRRLTRGDARLPA